MPNDGPAPVSGSKPAGIWASVRESLPTLLPLLLGAVSVAGFVTVVGGAIAWNRFNAVELPADQAVAALPESELVALGVGALVMFLLIGAGAVVLISQIESPGPCKRRWGLLTLVAGGMLYAIWLVPSEAPGFGVGLPWREKWVLTALILMAWLLAFGLLGWRTEKQARVLMRVVFGRSPTEGLRWWQKWLRRICGLTPYRDVGGWFRGVLSTNCETAAARMMMVLFGAEVSFAALLWALYDPWLGATLLIGGILGAICLLVADQPDQSGFGGYGLMIFVSVIVFGAGTEATQARYRPEVQPAALLRAGEEGGSGLCGLYVTENDERVYLGRLRSDPDSGALPVKDSGRIFFVNRDEVSALSIGPLMSIGAASARAGELRAELVTDQLPKPATAPASDTVVVTRTYERNGVKTEREHTRALPIRTTKRSATVQATVQPSGNKPTAGSDPALEARRKEAALSCTPPPLPSSGAKPRG